MDTPFDVQHDMRYEAYGWPVVGAVLEKVAPRPRYTMGVIRSGP